MPRLKKPESYLSITTAAAECAMEQIAKTKLGTFNMN